MLNRVQNGLVNFRVIYHCKFASASIGIESLHLAGAAIFLDIEVNDNVSGNICVFH